MKTKQERHEQRREANRTRIQNFYKEYTGPDYGRTKPCQRCKNPIPKNMPDMCDDCWGDKTLNQG